MVLITHIIIAVASVLLSLYLLVRPSHQLLSVLYTAIGLTLGSGVLLVLLGASWTHLCASSFVYTLIVATNAVVAKRRVLATDTVRD